MCCVLCSNFYLYHSLPAVPCLSLPSAFFPWLLADLRSNTCFSGNNLMIFLLRLVSNCHFVNHMYDESKKVTGVYHIDWKQRTPLGISSDDIEMADFLLDQVFLLSMYCFLHSTDWFYLQYTGSGRNLSIDNLEHLTNLFTDAWFAYGIDR